MLIASSPFDKTRSLSKPLRAEIWQDFLKRGSNHSPNASLIPYIIERCEREKVAYIIHATPGKGYFIEPDNKVPKG